MSNNEEFSAVNLFDFDLSRIIDYARHMGLKPSSEVTDDDKNRFNFVTLPDESSITVRDNRNTSKPENSD